MKNFLVILVLCILDQIHIQVVGVMSLLDLVALFYVVAYVVKNCGLGLFASDKEIIKITRLFALLFSVQIVAEMFSSGSMANAAKGFALTSMCYIKFLFLLKLFFRDKHNLVWFLLGTLIANILFFKTNDFFGLGEMDVDTEEMATGEGVAMAYFKFKISPLINSALVLTTLCIRRARAAWLFILVGLLTIVLGARSSGLVVLLTGCVPLLLYRHIRWNKKRLALSILLLGVVGWFGYRAYVQSVQSGEINSGNSQNQLAKMDNPYDVLELLKLGRSETYVGLVAMSESPWVGWGAWPADPGLRFNSMQTFLQGKRMDKRKFASEVIPTHSVLVGYGVYYGVLAMFLVGMIVVFFLIRGTKCLRSQSIFVYLVIFYMTNLIWDSLFSPVSTMRFQFVVYFASLYYIYKILKYPDLARQYGYVE